MGFAAKDAVEGEDVGRAALDEELAVGPRHLDRALVLAHHERRAGAPRASGVLRLFPFVDGSEPHHHTHAAVHLLLLAAKQQLNVPTS